MGFWYKGYNVNVVSDTDAYSAIARTGFLSRIFNSKAAVMELLKPISHQLPLGVQVQVEKIYQMKRGYEPNAPFRHGDVVATELFELVDKGAWHDPKTGKARAPRWKKIGEGSVKPRTHRDPMSKYYVIDFGADAVDNSTKRDAFVTAVAGLKEGSFMQAVVYVESEREKKPIRAYWLAGDEMVLKHSDKKADIARVIADMRPRTLRDPRNDTFNRSLLLDELGQWEDDPGALFTASWFSLIAKDAGIPLSKITSAEKTAYEAYRAKTWKPAHDRALRHVEEIAHEMSEQIKNASQDQIRAYVALREKRLEE